MLDAPTRLRNAIILGNLSITKRLLGRFPELWLNIDPNHDGWCNLHYAAYHGHYLICFHLITMMKKYKRDIPGHGTICDIDLVTFNNSTVFHMPLEHHYSQTLHYLLQAFSGSKWLDQKGGSDLRTPLHCCCEYDFLEGLNLFLEFGADWSVQDINGDTCLHICFANGSISCLQGLVKSIATRKTMTTLSKDLDVSSKEEGGPSLTALVLEVNDQLCVLEATLNTRGFTAFFQALSELIVTQYKTQKIQWITQCVESELALHENVPSVVSSANLTSLMNASFSTRPRLLSVSSSVTSSLGHIGHAISRSSLDSETPPPIATPQFDSLVLLSGREVISSARNSEAASTGRKHLSSLPNSSQTDNIVSQIAYDKTTQMRKHSKSFGYGYRTSPSQLRTPKLSLTLSMQPPSPHPFEFTRNQSLKSITISPLSRQNKRVDVDDVTEESELEESVGSSDSSIVSASSLAAVTPTSSKLLSQQFFSPLNSLRRRSVSATQVHNDSAKTSAEDVSIPKSTGSRSNLPFFRRNFSTPTFSLEGPPIGDGSLPKKSSRRPSIGGEPVGKPSLRLLIPESNSLAKPKTFALSPSSNSVTSDDFTTEPSPSTLSAYRVKPLLQRVPINRVGSILESSEENMSPHLSESVHSISFTRVRGE